MIIARVALYVAVLLLLPYQATAREKADVLIRHAAVVDVEHARISSDQAVATKGDRIVAVGNDADIAATWGAARQVDGKGRFLIPGTDAGYLNSFDYPAIGLHQELALYVENGLTPAEALAAATRAGPEWFGVLDRYGSVEVGKQADLVVLDANPLVDIHATSAINTVVLRGSVEDRRALDKVLADAKAKVVRWNVEAAK